MAETITIDLSVLLRVLASFVEDLEAHTVPVEGGRRVSSIPAGISLSERHAPVQDLFARAYVALVSGSREITTPEQAKAGVRFFEQQKIGGGGIDAAVFAAIDQVTRALAGASDERGRNQARYKLGDTIPSDAIEELRSAQMILKRRIGELREAETTSTSPGEAEERGQARTGIAKPRTLGQAEDWLATKNVMLSFVSAGSSRWIRRIDQFLGEPVWAAPRCRSLHRIESLINALEKAAPQGHFGDPPLRGRAITRDLRKSLHPPDYAPKWSDRATVRPE